MRGVIQLHGHYESFAQVWGIGETYWGEARLHPIEWQGLEISNTTRCCMLDVWGGLQWDFCPHVPLF